jgi:DNA (cytosine-5)-methyltransferase 1
MNEVISNGFKKFKGGNLMNVLSLFDGMSCGQIALRELGYKVDNYFASEIDKPAIKQTQHNFPNTKQLGSVTDVKAKDLPKIDLLIGGSPCQGFSFAGKQLNFNDHRSALFFEFVRIWNEVKAINPNAYFLLENVNMKKEHLRVISEYLGLFPVRINSNLVSAQNRDRWFWTNIKTKDVGLFSELWTDIPQPKDRGILLKDILQSEVDSKYFLSSNAITRLLNIDNDGFKSNIKNGEDKAACVFASQYKLARGMDMVCVAMRGRETTCLTPKRTEYGKEIRKEYERGLIKEQRKNIQQLEPREDGKTNTITSVQKDNLLSDGQRLRRLTPTECARLQTIPNWYEWVVSDTQIYRMLGNGWTVEVIKHIFSYLNGFEKAEVRGQKFLKHTENDGTSDK